MTEISSSQELLPFSQETYTTILNDIPAVLRDEIFNGLFEFPMATTESLTESSNTAAEEFLNSQISNFVTTAQSSCVPAIENYTGNHGFTVTIPSVSNMAKGAAPSYSYSQVLNKAFVKKGMPCPFNIYTNKPLHDCYIRAMLYFSSPEETNELVERCVNHKYKDMEAGDREHNHLLRCDSPNAQYFEESVTKRQSVTVPFENAPSGQNYSTYLYRFMCYTSCSGGPNRRPFCIVFTLEREGLILGRCRVDLKVCAGPSRDLKAEEKDYLAEKNASQEVAMVQASPPVAAQSSKKRKAEETEFIIKVPDEECYKLLLAVKKYYYLKKLFPKQSNWVPTSVDIANFLHLLSSSSDENKEN